MATYFTQAVDAMLPPSMKECLGGLAAISTEKISSALEKLENSMDDTVNGKDISYLARLIHSHVSLNYEHAVREHPL
jgi:arabinogalactan endo-1,4-beta-galactosidase